MNRIRMGAICRMLGLALVAVAMAVALPPHVAHGATLLHGSHWPLLGAMALGTSAIPAPISTGGQGGSAFSGIIPAELERRLKYAFFAPLRWVNLAAGATLAMQLVPDINHDVIIGRMTYTSRDAGTFAIVDRPPLFVEISLASGRYFTPGRQQLVELENIAGLNRGSPDLLIPMIVPASEQFTVTLTNGTAAQALNIQLDLIGARASRSDR